MTTQLTSPWPILDPASAELLQPGDFGGLVVRAEVQMQPVLDGLAPGNLEEHQVGGDAILRAPLRGLENDLVFLRERTPPAKRGLPEGGGPGRVGGVHTQALDAYTHGPTMASRPCLCPMIFAAKMRASRVPLEDLTHPAG
jgi:hypothetical protein